MSVWHVLWLHVQWFGLIGLALAFAFVLRNGIELAVRCQRQRFADRSSTRRSTSRPRPWAVEMPGRTRLLAGYELTTARD